jgi:hypothetical protein
MMGWFRIASGHEVLPDLALLSLSERLGWLIDASASNVADVTTPSRCLLSQLGDAGGDLASYVGWAGPALKPWQVTGG